MILVSHRPLFYNKMAIPSVFIDTCVFKAAIRFEVFGKFEHIRDTDENVVGGCTPMVELNYNDRILDQDQREECNRVREVAGLIEQGFLDAVTSHEVVLEFIGLPKTFPSSGGMLHGANYRIVRAPISLGYALTAPREDLRSLLEGISHPRFLEIRRSVGAYQGTWPVRLNQLFDALLLWTAEEAGCQYFLTVDKKLLKYDFKSEALECVRPSGLIDQIKK